MRRARVTETAWSSAVWSCALNVVGMPFELVIGRSVPHMPLWPPFVSMGCGLLMLGFLVAQRRLVSPRACSTVFVLNAVIIAAVFTIRGEAYARFAETWAPFQANKLGALVVALLAPELWTGVLSICAYAGAALTQWALFPPEVRDRLDVGEPVTTITFGLFAFILLGYHLRRLALEREVAKFRSVLAIRDLSNTPLQIIELSTTLIRAGAADPATNLDRIDRATTRLRDLNQIAADDGSMTHPATPQASFDAFEVLRPSK